MRLDGTQFSCIPLKLNVLYIRSPVQEPRSVHDLEPEVSHRIYYVSDGDTPRGEGVVVHLQPTKMKDR